MIFNFCIQYTWNHLFKVSDSRKNNGHFLGGVATAGATRNPGGHSGGLNSPLSPLQKLKNVFLLKRLRKKNLLTTPTNVAEKSWESDSNRNIPTVAIDRETQ